MLALIRNVGLKRNLRSKLNRHISTDNPLNSKDSEAKQIAEGVMNESKHRRDESVGDEEDDPKKIAEDVFKGFPEAPTTCCMTGCANCVWLDYAEKLADYYKDGGEKAMKDIEEQIDDGNMRAFIMHEIRMRLKK